METPSRRRRDIAIVLAAIVILMTFSFVFPVVTRAQAEPYPSGWQTDWSVNTGSIFKHASPELADIDKDGYLETVVGNYNGYVYCFDAFGKQRWSYGTGAPVEGAPLVIDIDGSGTSEIFFGSDNGWVYGLNWQGQPLAGWPQSCGSDSGFQGVFGSPAAGDIDGDGGLEIVAGSWGHYVFAWHTSGAVVAGFPFSNYDTIWSSPAVSDIDLDGRSEIIIGADCTGAYWWYPPGGILWVIRGNGTVQAGFPKLIRQVIWSSPAVADLNLDGFPEIIVGTGHYYGEDVAQGDGYHVYAWDHLGNPVPGWPVNTSGNVFSSPAVADVNGDGFFEVACASLDGWLYLWANDGRLIWQRHVWTANKLASPVIGDVDGNGVLDIVIGDSWDLTAWDANGNKSLGQPLNGIIWSTAALGDIDHDGRVEIVVGSGAGSEGGGTLFCYEGGAYDAGRMPWPMFRRDAAHSAGLPHQEVPDAWSASEIKSQWYLAEGYTGPGFSEYVLVMNPLDRAASIQLRYLLPSGMSVVKIYSIGAHSRFTIPVNSLIQGMDVSIAAISNNPGLVVERAMYFNYEGKTGGTSVVGIDEPATTWYLAEGYTGGTFDTYVLMANPNQQSTAEVDVTYMTDGGPVNGGHYSLRPKSRMTVHVDDLLPASNVSTKVISSVPIAVERAMYFVYNGSAGVIDGGHGAKAVNAPGLAWYMAEGYTAGDFDTWLLVQNPNANPANCVATFMQPGGGTQDFSFQVGGNSRYTLPVDAVSGMEATEFSTRLSSDIPVIAERAMYFNYNGLTGGHDVIGATAPELLWYLAEGYTADAFDTYILIQNPGAVAASVNIQYLESSGQVITKNYSVAANSRSTVQVDLIPELSSSAFSSVISSDVPVIVERAMYFNYMGLTGGHDTLGYAP